MRSAFRTRLRFISGILLLIALLFISRLYFLQIVHGADFSLKAERQYENESRELYDRGTIYATRKDGTLISAAALGTGFLLAVNPERITDAEAAYEALNSIVPLDRETFLAHANKQGDPYEEIAHHLSEDAGKAIAALSLPGVIVERERWRTYPLEKTAAQTVGFTGYGSDNGLAGRYGLERYYEDVVSRSRNLFGNFFAELFSNVGNVVVDARSAREGDIVTSLEPVVEQELDRTLLAITAKYRSAETGGIIMIPSTGAIIALDTVPSFDPNTFASGDPAYFANPLVEHVYEFGSIVKALTMAAGLDSGVITPDSMYTDTGCIHVDTATICNYDGKARGTVPMQEILSQSLNLGAAHIADVMGHERVRSYFTRLGFGSETGIDLPNETHGIVTNLQSPRDVEYDTASFGQGIAMTPVEVIRAMGALANGGAIVTPHLVNAVRLESGITKTLSWGPSEQVFTPASAEAVTRMLVTVVDTALSKGAVKIPEMSVAAKTGTAQMANPSGGYYKDRYFHSFFGYFPAYDPRFIILLYTREPKDVQYASETLTHPFIDLVHFLMNYYAIPPDRAQYETNP